MVRKPKRRKRKRRGHDSRDRVYQRHECILAVEGKVSPDLLVNLLTSRDGVIFPEQRFAIPGAPYKNIPFEDIDRDFALLTRKDITVRVFDGKPHLKRRLLSVYRPTGIVTQNELDRLRRGDEWLVDFSGSKELQRDKNGNPLAWRIRGCGKEEVFNGDTILAREARPGEPPESDFVVQRLNGSGDISIHELGHHPLVRKIPPGAFGREAIACIDLSISGSVGPGEDAEPMSVIMDPSTGNLQDGVTPDGEIFFGMNKKDQVVLVMENRTATALAAKGTKREMLDSTDGTLASFRKDMPPDMVEAGGHAMLDSATSAIKAYDPDSGVLIVFLKPYEDQKCEVKTIPAALLPSGGRREDG
jgi:hypothetical protein